MDNELKNLPKIGTRHIQYFLILLGLLIGYSSLRVNLSVGIIGMTDKNHPHPEYQSFNWDTPTKQILLSSLIWGYIAGQIPGGLVAKRFGAKHLIGFAVLSSSILSLIAPVLTIEWDWTALMVLRILTGFCQGSFLPAILIFETKWTPKNELARITVFMGSGNVFGTFLTLALSGIISVELGWPYVFYIPGILGLIWTFFWYIFSANTPAEHSRISNAEKKYIQDSLGHSDNSHKNYVPTPWVKIFTSIPFYASLIAYCCNGWIYWLLLIESPIYLNGMFEISLNKNGLLSSIPYLSRFFFEYFLIGIEFLIMKKKWMSIKNSRKFFTVIGFIIPAICIAILPFIPKQLLYLTILVLLIGNSTNAAVIMGSNLAAIDMSPNHAGTLLALSSTVAGLISNLAPLLVGLIVTNEKDQTQWQIIFVSTSIFLVIGCIVFLIFGSNEVQHWNDMKTEKCNDKD